MKKSEIAPRPLIFIHFRVFQLTHLFREFLGYICAGMLERGSQCNCYHHKASPFFIRVFPLLLLYFLPVLFFSYFLQIFFFLTSYAIPLALICGLYLVMLMRLWKGVAPGGHVSAESKRGKKRVTRLVVIVVAVFAICWFPIQVRFSSIYNLFFDNVFRNILGLTEKRLRGCTSEVRGVPRLIYDGHFGSRLLRQMSPSPFTSSPA